MKRLLLALLALAPLVAHAQTAYQTCVFSDPTHCIGVGPGTTGQAFVSAGASAYPAFSSSLPGVTSVNGTTIPLNGTLYSIPTLVNGDILSNDGTALTWVSGGTGTVSDGSGTTTANEVAVSTTTAHTIGYAATLPTSALPALTGDVTSSAGSNSVTVSKVLGLTWPSPLVNGDCLTNNGTALSWGTCGTGGSVTLQTNGTNNASQTTLNLVGTGNVSVTNPSGGTVDIGPISEPVNAQTGTTYTVATTDCGKQLTFSNASAIAVTVPQANGSFATCQFDVTDLGAGTATLTPTTSTINGSASLAIAQNRQCTVNSDGTNWQVIGCTALVSGSGSGITLENGGSSLGTITTLNCSTGTTCSASGGVGTLTASGGSSATAISFGTGPIAQSQTAYVVPGTSSTSGVIVSAVVPRAGTLQDLYFSTANAPASGQTFIITLYTGTVAGSLTATTVTCTISNPNKSCSDTTDTASIAAGSSWDVQVVTSATSGSTGTVGFGIQLQ